MFRKLVKKVIGDPTERALSQYRLVVDEINALEPDMKKLTDEQMRAKSDEFRQRLTNGETLDDLMVEAFALVREAAVRTIGLRHYDVQMIGGMVLHQGRIAEMRTGEGKTLVATLPLYLNALEGRGAHLVTPNDYLSKVGLQTMGPIYHLLGLSAGVIQSMGQNPAMSSFIYDPDAPSDDARYQNLRPVTRQEAYNADITYGTNNEYGFDYLRANMAYDQSQIAQRELRYAIVDEVDSILIDEARTPLIISGPADPPSEHYKTFAAIVKTLKRSTPDSVDDDEPDGDYVVDIKDRVAYLTESGVEKVEHKLNIERLYDPENAELIPYLDNCLRAHALYQRDKEYIVQDGEVIIVDEFTGRLMHGRRFSEGLHEAIEAKEGVQIRRQNLTLATITYQNFFRMYDKLAGMTGTAVTESEEFEKIYDLEVVAIPTNLPVIREDNDDFIFMSARAKWNAVVDEIKARQERGQPVLVGTVAIETSEHLSKLLTRAKVDHEVLNAKQHEREATIIAQAGRPGAVTIATNMAGRGVDILLGGNPEGQARDMLHKQGIDVTEASPEQWKNALTTARAECAQNRQHILDVGGLYVLGTERHEARRIDNQLRGRSGRQGDPGETRFFLSLEDELMQRFMGDRVKNFMSWANMPEDEPLEHSMITKSVSQAQVRVEGHNFDIRKRVLEYDDVVNRQREIIYEQRRNWVTSDDLTPAILEVIDDLITDALDTFLPEVGEPEDADLEALHHHLYTIFPVPAEITPETMVGKSLDELEEELIAAAHAMYEKKAAELNAVEDGLMHRAERQAVLRAIDANWQRHLTDLDILREGIGLMSVAQRDPLVEYQREAFNMFKDVQDNVHLQMVRMIFSMQVQVAQRQPVRRPMRTLSGNGAASNKPETVRKTAKEKLGRNDPCWCGSGKKYKQCHLKEDRAAQRA